MCFSFMPGFLTLESRRHGCFSHRPRAGTTTVTPDGELQDLVFALKNTCDGATMGVGIYNLASLGWILISLIVLTLYQRRKQRQIDEKAQTAQDYSIEIRNPPGDATEPEEWKDFFESRFGGHVTCCTVTIDNDLLVKTLAERRGVIALLEEKVREGSMINAMKLSELAAREEHGRRFFGNLKSRIDPGIPELVGRLTVLNAKIQGLTQQEYVATRVFCTFETESAQRQVLSEMMVGSMSAYRNNTHVINANLLFTWRREHRDAAAESSVSQAAVLLPVRLARPAAEECTASTVQMLPTPAAANRASRPGVIELEVAGAHLRLRGAVDEASLCSVLRALRQSA